MYLLYLSLQQTDEPDSEVELILIERHCLSIII